MAFAAGWLDLREPADAAARDPGLLAAAAAWLGDGLAVDLGCGTGALARAFPPGARWRLVDADADLLALAAARTPGAEIRRRDLAPPGPAASADRPGQAPGDRLADHFADHFDGARLVAASALFDLAGAAWIAALAGAVAARRLGLYAALSYDGRVAFAPALPGDAPVLAAFNRHQLRDKGLGGPALGPAAAGALAQALAAAGCLVRVAESPWQLGPGPLQAALVAGMAAAAAEAGFAGAAAWGQARRAASGAGSCVVGHRDVLALPGPSAQSKTTSVPRP